jgi:hypothetical protein
MVFSVRLDPVLAAAAEEEAKGLGISKSEPVKNALELRLGIKSSHDLLRRVRSSKPMSNPSASESTGAGLKAKLRAKRSD